jgi:hypothetical protein
MGHRVAFHTQQTSSANPIPGRDSLCGHTLHVSHYLQFPSILLCTAAITSRIRINSLGGIPLAKLLTLVPKYGTFPVGVSLLPSSIYQTCCNLSFISTLPVELLYLISSPACPDASRQFRYWESWVVTRALGSGADEAATGCCRRSVSIVSGLAELDGRLLDCGIAAELASLFSFLAVTGAGRSCGSIARRRAASSLAKPPNCAAREYQRRASSTLFSDLCMSPSAIRADPFEGSSGTLAEYSRKASATLWSLEAC